MNKELLNELLIDEDILEPDTIRQLGPEYTEEDINQILALKVVRHNRHFWENFIAFEDIVLALNGEVPDFTMIQGCTPEQVWFAVQLVEQIRPGLEYSDEIKLYVKAMFNEVGVFIYPAELGIENPYFTKAKELAIDGPFPLGEESIEEIQAAKYLSIIEYMKEHAI